MTGAILKAVSCRVIYWGGIVCISYLPSFLQTDRIMNILLRCAPLPCENDRNIYHVFPQQLISIWIQMTVKDICNQHKGVTQTHWGSLELTRLCVNINIDIFTMTDCKSIRKHIQNLEFNPATPPISQLEWNFWFTDWIVFQSLSWQKLSDHNMLGWLKVRMLVRKANCRPCVCACVLVFWKLCLN